MATDDLTERLNQFLGSAATAQIASDLDRTAIEAAGIAVPPEASAWRIDRGGVTAAYLVLAAGTDETRCRAVAAVEPIDSEIGDLVVRAREALIGATSAEDTDLRS